MDLFTRRWKDTNVDDPVTSFRRDGVQPKFPNGPACKELDRCNKSTVIIRETPPIIRTRNQNPPSGLANFPNEHFGKCQIFRHSGE